MLIGLCDDSRTWCEFATAVLEDFLKENGWDAELISFAGSRELLEEYTGSIPDILFLDIELEEERDGISLAKEINLRYPECQIVFLTDYLYYAVDIFETKHAYFVLKEQFEDRLPEIFHKLMYRLDQSCQRLVFSVAWGREMLVKPSEMLFLERDMRHTIVHTLWGDFQVKEKLDELMQQFAERGFSRCHHSYVVYFPAVREKKKNSYVLENGREIAISRSYMKQTNEDWMQWAVLQMS